MLADRARLAQRLSVRKALVAAVPDDLLDPKRALIDLARRSRSPQLQRALVPQPNSGRTAGTDYTSTMIEFVNDKSNGWRPEVAAGRSESLRRCMERLAEVAAG